MLVQHMGEVPESLPVTEETRERLRAQANQLGEATVLRLCDLLAVAVDDMRQGGDPRLPLELALVKVTRPGADLSARVDRLPARAARAARRACGPAPATCPQGQPQVTDPERQPEAAEPAAGAAVARARAAPGGLAAHGPAGGRARGRSRPRRCSARRSPSALEDDTLTLEFPRERRFHRKLAEEPKNATLLRDALYEVTGRKLAARVRARRERGRARARRRSRRARRTSSRWSRRPSTPGRWTNEHGQGFDMNKLLQQAQQMQAQMAAGPGGARRTRPSRRRPAAGWSPSRRPAPARSVEIKIDPKAIDPDDPELLEDMVLAAVNEALRSAQALAQSKLGGYARRRSGSPASSRRSGSPHRLRAGSSISEHLVAARSAGCGKSGRPRSASSTPRLLGHRRARPSSFSQRLMTRMPVVGRGRRSCRARRAAGRARGRPAAMCSLQLRGAARRGRRTSRIIETTAIGHASFVGVGA